jgi:uncharacterized protein HemX
MHAILVFVVLVLGAGCAAVATSHSVTLETDNAALREEERLPWSVTCRRFAEMAVARKNLRTMRHIKNDIQRDMANAERSIQSHQVLQKNKFPLKEADHELERQARKEWERSRALYEQLEQLTSQMETELKVLRGSLRYPPFGLTEEICRGFVI